MFVVAGITFLTANGEPDKLKTARSALLWGTIGIVVAIIAYSIIGIISGALTADSQTFLELLPYKV
jgi:FtsH-binding integral membrane protein